MNEAYILATLIKNGVKVAVTNCIISNPFNTGAILVPITGSGNRQALIETVLVCNAAQMERSAFRPIPEGMVRLIAYNDFSGFKHVFTKDVPENKLFDYLADVMTADNSVFVSPGYSSHAMNYGQGYAHPGTMHAEAIGVAITEMKARVTAGLDQTKELVINYNYTKPIPPVGSKPETPMPDVESRLNPLFNKHGLNPQQPMPVAKAPFLKKPVISLEGIPSWLTDAVEHVTSAKSLPIQAIYRQESAPEEKYFDIKDTFNRVYCLEIQFLYRHFKGSVIDGAELYNLTCLVRNHCVMKAIQDAINPNEEVFTREYLDSLESEFGLMNGMSKVELIFTPADGVKAEIQLRIPTVESSETVSTDREKELVHQMMSVLQKASQGDYEEEMKGISTTLDKLNCDTYKLLPRFISGVCYKYPELIKDYGMDDMVIALGFVCIAQLLGDRLNRLPFGYPVQLVVKRNSRTNCLNITAKHGIEALSNIVNLADWCLLDPDTNIDDIEDYLYTVPNIHRRLERGIQYKLVEAKSRSFKLVSAY